METILSEGLLASHTLVDTRSPDDARHQIGQIFCPHFLSPKDKRAAGFHAVHRCSRQGAYSLNLVSYGCEVDIDPGELSRFFLLQIPIAGSAIVHCGKTSAQARPGEVVSILSPTLPTRMRWSDGCAKIIVLLERGAMERQWSSMVGRCPPAVEFTAGIDIAGAAGHLLMNHVRLMVESIEAGDISPHYQVRLGDDLMLLLLSSFAHSQRGLLERQARPGDASVVARAEDWIRANIARPFSVADIATASGCSLRSLQETLRREKGTTLTHMIETIRLEAFRARLIHREQCSSVTEAAFAVGLGHLGRAASAYQKRYGETPSQTLRRR